MYPLLLPAVLLLAYLRLPWARLGLANLVLLALLLDRWVVLAFDFAWLCWMRAAGADVCGPLARSQLLFLLLGVVLEPAFEGAGQWLLARTAVPVALGLWAWDKRRTWMN
jgi:hypothetical protein